MEQKKPLFEGYQFGNKTVDMNCLTDGKKRIGPYEFVKVIDSRV